MAVALLLSSSPAWAAPYETDPQPSGLDKRLVKLGRGFANAGLGWAEIPVTFDEDLHRGKPVTYLLCVSPVIGAARMFTRIGVGVLEVVTFPFSWRGLDYGPLLQPEYVPE
jgi:putative exosortase-associated protein (TIGR04073 family)